MYLYLDRALRVGPHRRPHSGVLLLAMIRAARPGGQLHSCFSGPQGVADLRSRPGLQLTSEQAMGVAYFPLNFPPGLFTLLICSMYTTLALRCYYYYLNVENLQVLT